MTRSESWSNQDELRFQREDDCAVDVVAALRREASEVIYTPGARATLVATAYLDTADGAYFRLFSSSGGKRSVKIRLREYFALSEKNDGSILGVTEHCYVERKERVGVARTKQRVEMTKDAARRFLLGDRDALGDSREADAIRAEFQRHELAPVVVSAYERRVWGDGSELRITYDQRLRFHRPPAALFDRTDTLAPSALGAPLGFGLDNVLEIKIDSGRALPVWLATLTDRLRRVDDYSRFRDGITQLRGAGTNTPVQDE